MSFIIRIIKQSWRLMPSAIRNRVRALPGLAALRNWAARWRWRGVDHDDIYDDEYFRFVDRTSGQSATVMATTIIQDFHPASVIDVGCGTGSLLCALRDRGVRVRGLERAESALTYCHARQLDVRTFDLLNDLPDPEDAADVVISMEVGAQLPENAAERYIDVLCSLGSIQVFSVEQPGGGDKLPLNEQPHKYWIEKFSARGFTFDQPRSLAWRAQWQEHRIAEWFCRNVMIFIRKE